MQINSLQSSSRGRIGSGTDPSANFLIQPVAPRSPFSTLIRTGVAVSSSLENHFQRMTI